VSPARLAPEAAIVALAIAVGAAGSVRLPLDDHEAYVVQTAQEMRDRGDWLVPHFFGAPRLQKPPLSYWLTAAVATASGDARVRPWHGRVPSIAAAACIVALTMALGHMLLDRRLARIAGIVAASSVGVFRYAHTARPDMLYALWCTLALAAFVAAVRAPGEPRRAARLLWTSLALATLTKGPQVPAMLLVAMMAVTWGRGWRPTALRRILRPVEGGCLLVVLTVPWWLAVHHALGGSGLAGTQLAGSLLAPSARHLLDPYHFYRPLALVLPSVAFAALAPLMGRWPRDRGDAVRLLATFVLVPALTFTLGPQRRPHYMLPALAPLSLLVAVAMAAVFERGERRSAGGGWPACLVGTTWVLTFAILLRFAATPVLWSHERFAVAELATLAARTVPREVPLLALGVHAPAPSYHAERPVRAVRTLRRVHRILARSTDGRIALLTDAAALSPLPASVEARVVARRPADGGREMLLVRLRIRNGS
jgi:4-amino-4-deoxy-L-arabinose transferase-like glycosyltransferase